MGMPHDVGIVDTMIGFPHADTAGVYDFITRQTKDRESKEDFRFPAEYLFTDAPDKELGDRNDPVAVTLTEMDRWGVERGLVGVDGPDGVGADAVRRYPRPLHPLHLGRPQQRHGRHPGHGPGLRDMGYPGRRPPFRPGPSPRWPSTTS